MSFRLSNVSQNSKHVSLASTSCKIRRCRSTSVKSIACQCLFSIAVILTMLGVFNNRAVHYATYPMNVIIIPIVSQRKLDAV